MLILVECQALTRNEKMFKKNPLTFDKTVMSGIQRYQTARNVTE